MGQVCTYGENPVVFLVIDYNAIGNVAAEGDDAKDYRLIGSGRDQANVLKALIDETLPQRIISM